MSEERFEVIIIGAGLAGLSAAYRLAKEGRKVLVLEKGPYGGSKNVSGGRIYTYALDKLMGNDWKGKAPLERPITSEYLMMMNDKDAMTIETTVNESDGESYSVLREKFDKWLQAQAEAAGAMVIGGATVDGLIIRDGKVCGITSLGEEIECDLVIDAEGANPIVAERAGIIDPIKIENMAVSAKYVIKLDKKIINDRFNLEDNQGAAMLGMGDANKGEFGGLFLYTNIDTISIGLVLGSKQWKESGKHLPDAIEDLKEHPTIGRYLKGGEVVEYTAHLVPEGGWNSLSTFADDGILITGDAAGLCLNRGFTIRGMDYAILSGIAAADAANRALEEGNFSKEFLQNYEARLQQGVLKDFKTLRNAPHYMGNSNELFTTYPELAINLMQNLYSVDGNPAKSVVGIVRKSLRGVNLVDVARDALKGVRSL